MRTLALISSLNTFLETGDKLILTDLLSELNNEYKLEAAKKQGGMSAVKRLKLINKLLERNKKTIPHREEFGKLYVQKIDSEERQCLIGNAYAVILNKGYYVDAETNGAECKGPDFGALLPDYKKHDYKEIEFDIADIKKDFAQWKLEQKHKPKSERDKYCTLPIGNVDGIGFNPQYFIELYEILGNNESVQFYQNQTSIGTSYFLSNVGVSILCPCRLKK